MLFCAIVGLLAAGVDSSQGDAPRDTVALPSVISELRDGFRNCQFVAVQTKELTAPTKLKFKKESRAVGMICDNCCVLKIRIVMIERPNPNPATPGPVTKNSEFRFRSGQRVEEIKLRLDESQEWPSKESVDDRRQYESFTVLDLNQAYNL